MASLAEATKALIQSMPQSATWFPGGVWTRPIMPEDRTGPDGILWKSTPAAFDPLVPIQIMRCISINMPDRTTSFTNWMDQFFDYAECWYYGPDTPADRAVLSQAMEAVRTILSDRPITYDSGTLKIMPNNNRTHIQPTGEFFHAVYAMERFTVISFDM